MKAFAAVLLTIVAISSATPAHAIRIALYRLGAAGVAPGSLEDPGTYGAGYGFNAGVSVPFMHRTAITLDVAHDRLAWEDGSEPTVDTEVRSRNDLSVTSFLLGADIAFRRGHSVRPLIHVGLGAARVRAGDAEVMDQLARLSTAEGGSETVFAVSASAGVRIRTYAFGTVRMTAGWMGLAREEFAYVVPLRVQVEF